MVFNDQEIAGFAGFAERLRDAARGETLPRFRAGAAVVNKNEAAFDPVTEADREAERAMRALIEEAFPDHGIVGEEFGVREGKGPWRWVLDPVDGTRAFVCGAPTWTTLIALEHEGRPVLGIIDQPYSDDCLVGFGGETRFHRGGVARACRASGVAALAEARLSTTDPSPNAYFDAAAAAAFARLAEETRVSRYSMDAYAYGLLAAGELDLIVETKLQHHDYAALVPVIENAGGVITNWKGEPVGSDTRGETLAAATPALHEAAMKVLAGA